MIFKNINKKKTPQKGWVKLGPFNQNEIKTIDDTLGWWNHFEDGPSCSSYIIEGDNCHIYIEYDAPEYFIGRLKDWCSWPEKEIDFEIWEPTSLKDHIKDRKVFFEYFRDGELWYRVNGTGFLFPVPVDSREIGSATFKQSDDAIYFMRYIRKYFEKIERENMNE